jgi:two-component system alkaline phosphatase synthesis response regulator PhoP
MKIQTKPMKTILVLDDDNDLSGLIKLLLEQMPGINVLTCENRQRADIILQQETISLLILDAFYPTGEGFVIAKKYKNDPATAAIPILLISGHQQAEELYQAAGADAFISKPFDLRYFKKTVSGLLHPSG